MILSRFVALSVSLTLKVSTLQLDKFERFYGHPLSSTGGVQTMALDPTYSDLYLGMSNSMPAQFMRIRLDELYGPKILAKTARIMETLIPDPHRITWDTGDPWDHMENVVGGYVHNGGGDMYDTGNLAKPRARGSWGKGGSKASWDGMCVWGTARMKLPWLW